jgi:hypothetical protein
MEAQREVQVNLLDRWVGEEELEDIFVLDF